MNRFEIVALDALDLLVVVDDERRRRRTIMQPARATDVRRVRRRLSGAGGGGVRGHGTSDSTAILVNRADGHRALTNGRRDPFHRATAYITGDEYAGETGLELERCAVERPPGSRRTTVCALRLRNDEAPVIARNGAA